MSGWRNIIVDGTKYRWRGHSYVMVITESEEKFASATACQIKGITWSDWERGHWKKTPDGMMTPDHVAEFIRRVVNGEKFDPEPAPTRKQRRENELAHIAGIEKQCIVAIQGQNWTDDPLTAEEKNLIEMAVSWTYHYIRKEGL